MVPLPGGTKRKEPTGIPSIIIARTTLAWDSIARKLVVIQTASIILRSVIGFLIWRLARNSFYSGFIMCRGTIVCVRDARCGTNCVRTIVEVETDEGLIGLGEMGGGGESAEATFRAMKTYLVGHDPARLEEMRFLIANPTASLYNNRTQILAALEFACLDILGQKWGVPVCDILGGRLRDRVPFASYCFFRYPNPETGAGEIRTMDQMIEAATELKQRFGFTTHKLKGGVFHPDYELDVYRALAAVFPDDRLRFDPNAVWSTEQAI